MILVLNIIMAIAIGMLIGLFAILLIMAYDYITRTVEKGLGVIINKTFIKAHSAVEYNIALKMPLVKSVSDEWKIEVLVKNLKATTSVNREFYNSLETGDHVDVEYYIGKLSGKLYINGVYKICR